jgi:hypothetical protein
MRRPACSRDTALRSRCFESLGAHGSDHSISQILSAAGLAVTDRVEKCEGAAPSADPVLGSRSVLRGRPAVEECLCIQDMFLHLAPSSFGISVVNRCVDCSVVGKRPLQLHPPR